MSETDHRVFTIGHSNHSPGAFLALLRAHGIEEVMDVRSSPYSRYAPHFGYDALNRALEDAGIGYEFLGGELGGRPADRSSYDEDGRVRYDRVAESDSFDAGIRRVERAADERRVALMCSEKEPLDCHRTLLVARALDARGVCVEHILADGAAESHSDAMDRLLDDMKLPRGGDMFRSREDTIGEALDRRARKAAYVAEAPSAYGVGAWGSSR